MDFDLFFGSKLGSDKIKHIEGWLTPSAQILSELILFNQVESECVTGAIEFGVYKGKYLSLIAYYYRNSDVPVIGVDAFLDGYGAKLQPKFTKSAQKTILDNAASLSSKKPELINAFTQEIDKKELSSKAPKGFSYISVDAGHEKEDLLHDIPIAEQLLSEGGVVAFDDVFNWSTPGVGEGFFQHFSQNRGGLAPFAICGNKVFCSQNRKYNHYFDFCRKIAFAAETKFPDIATSTGRIRRNEEKGIVPKLLGHPVVLFR